jgi:hypothetical protein
LASAGATGRLQILSELRILALEPIALALDALEPLAQARDLAGLLVDQAAWRFPIWLRPVGAPGHAMVMPDSGSKYKALRARTR